MIEMCIPGKSSGLQDEVPGNGKPVLRLTSYDLSASFGSKREVPKCRLLRVNKERLRERLNWRRKERLTPDHKEHNILMFSREVCSAALLNSSSRVLPGKLIFVALPHP